MESILICPQCKLNFDLNEQNPRILPCNRLICCKCIESYKQALGGYFIKCDCPKALHKMNELDDIYPSQLSLFYLNIKNKKPSDQFCSSFNADSSSQILDNMKILLENYKYKLELTKFDINKHYDDMEMDIDIRAETLINIIHDSRDSLVADIKNHRDETNLNLELFQEEFSSDLVKLETKFESLLGKANEPDFSENDANELKKLIKEFNKSQRSVEEMKKKAWYFVENTTLVDKSLLGYNLNNNFDKNYLKVKNINFLLANELKQVKICLKPKFAEEKLRTYIVPISRKLILSCYFSIAKHIFMELFDENGESLKLQRVAENVTYFPIIVSCNDAIVLSYISKIKLRSPEIFGESTVSYVSLFDTNLNQIKTITDKSLIESIYMNSSKIVCSFAHKTFDSCKVYDFELNFIESFGQQSDKEKPFFMEKSILNNARPYYSSKDKLNPIVFGYTENNIYFYNTKAMYAMSRKLGAIVKTVNKINEKSYFILDSQLNLIEINTSSNKIKLINFENEISVESNYDLNYDEVHLIEDNYFAFIDKSKETLIFV